MVFSSTEAAVGISRPAACVEAAVAPGMVRAHASLAAGLSREASLATTSPKNSSSKGAISVSPELAQSGEYHVGSVDLPPPGENMASGGPSFPVDSRGTRPILSVARH